MSDCYIDNEKLIQFVKKSPALYDNTCELYKNKDHTDELWKQISRELETTVELVKLRWMALRNSFLREIRNEIAFKNKKKRRRIWYLTKEMDFLRNFVYSGGKKASKISKTDKSADNADDEDDDESDSNHDNSNFGSETMPARVMIKPEYSYPKECNSDPLTHAHVMQPIIQPLTSTSILRMPDEDHGRSFQGGLSELGEQNLAFFRSIIPDILKLTERRQRLFRQSVMSVLNQSLDEQDTDDKQTM